MHNLFVLTVIVLSISGSFAKVDKRTCTPADIAMKEGSVVTKNYLSDKEIRSLSKNLADKIDFSTVKGIVAITRGGLAPTLLVSQYASVKDIRTIGISSYGDDCKRGELRIITDPHLDNEGDGFLFIDDLVDSGETLRKIRAMYPKAKFAVLYAKPAGESVADFYVKKVPQGEWLVFPWEPDWIAPKNN